MKSKIIILGMAFCLLSCDKETVLSSTEIPTEISEYVTLHFPNNKILQVIKDVDGFKKSYDITLDGGITLEFNRKKEIREIDGTTELPESVIPSKLKLYVDSNFPNNFITDWELEGKNQQIGLDNGLDLEFKMNGDFIRIDS